MFQIPEEHLPDFAKDEQKLTVLFAPLRNRTVNSKDWENKITSWKKLIGVYLLCNEEYSFTLSSLSKVFVRNGRPPLCLKEVLMQMLKDGEIQVLDKYLAGTSSTWSGWAAEVLIKKPLTWSFNKLKNTVFVNTDDFTYVDVQLIKTRSNEIIGKIPKDHINKVMSLSDLLKILNKTQDYTPKLKLLLHNLSNEKKVAIHIKNTKNNEESYLVKFSDQDKLTPIHEVEIGIYSLEKNEKLLADHVEELEEEIESLKNQAKLHLGKGHRQTAKTCLRKKHEIEKRLIKKADALHNIQILLERIKDTHTDAHVWESYKQAVESFDKLFKDTGLSEDAVEDTMIKLGEVLETHEDIQSAISKPLDVTSDSDLEQELADLLTTNEPPPDKPSNIEQQLENLHLDLPNLNDSTDNTPKLEQTIT